MLCFLPSMFLGMNFKRKSLSNIYRGIGRIYGLIFVKYNKKLDLNYTKNQYTMLEGK